MHRPATSVIVTVIGHIELFVRRKCQSKRITKSPGDKFERRTITRHAHNGPAARNSPMNQLSWLSLGAERHKRSCHSFIIRLRRKRIWGREVNPTKGDVFAG